MKKWARSNTLLVYFYVFISKERFKYSGKQILLWTVGMANTTHSFAEMILK